AFGLIRCRAGAISLHRQPASRATTLASCNTAIGTSWTEECTDVERIRWATVFCTGAGQWTEVGQPSLSLGEYHRIAIVVHKRRTSDRYIRRGDATARQSCTRL